MAIVPGSGMPVTPACQFPGAAAKSTVATQKSRCRSFLWRPSAILDSPVNSFPARSPSLRLTVAPNVARSASLGKTGSPDFFNRLVGGARKTSIWTTIGLFARLSFVIKAGFAGVLQESGMKNK